MALVERRDDDRNPKRPNAWDERQARVDASVGPNKRQRLAETYKELLDDETRRIWNSDDELRRPLVPRFNPQALPWLSSTFTTSMQAMFYGYAPTSADHLAIDVTSSDEHLRMAMNDVSRANPFYEYNFENLLSHTLPPEENVVPRGLNQLLAQTRAPHVDADMESITGVESWRASLIADRDNPPREVSDDFEIHREEIEVIVEAEEEPDSDATPAYSSPSSEY